MLGILCATDEEFAALQEVLVLGGEPQSFGPTQVWSGHGLALAKSGIGKVNAAAAATLMLSNFGVRALVLSGVAGGLHPDWPVGTVLLATSLAVHDYGLVAGERFTPTRSGTIPIGAPELTELAPVPEPVAVTLAQLAERVAPRIDGQVSLGGITTADYFLNCGVSRLELRSRLGADAIDMESGAVGQVADAWGVPLYVIRTLSDLAGDESSLTYLEMASMAARNSAICVEELLSLIG